MNLRSPRRTLAALAAGCLVAVAGAGAAYADDISNDLDPTIDAVAETMPLNVGGPNGTTQLYVTPRNGDGKSGCNLTGGTSLVVSLASSNTAVATVSPSTVTFTSCGGTPTVTVTPVSTGSATVSATQASNNTGGTFNLAPVTFTVAVAPPANTAPSVVVAGVAGGASYAKGSVPAATCQVTDAEDGPSSFAATLSAVTGPHAVDGIGSQTASCSYTDRGGLTATASETYTIADPSAPVISYTLSPATPDGDNGWYRGAVVLDWTVSEPESPSSLSLVGCEDLTVSADQAATTYTCQASSAGGSASAETVAVKRDATAPVVSAAGVTGTLGSNGWYTSPVTASFTATDVLSGPASATGTTSSGSAEGAAVVLGSPVFTDAAGNASLAGAASQTVKIDLGDPSASFDTTLSGTYFHGEVPAQPTCTASDAVSGPAGCVVTGYSTALGTHTLVATATDVAGRTSSTTASYTVSAWRKSGFYQPVDMTALNTVKGGSTVPVKFELFASQEITDPAAITGFTYRAVSCDPSVSTDEIEQVTTATAGLRYDPVAGQFVYNWKTPTKAGCYALSMTTRDGGAPLVATFKTR